MSPFTVAARMEAREKIVSHNKAPTKQKEVGVVLHVANRKQKREMRNKK